MHQPKHYWFGVKNTVPPGDKIEVIKVYTDPLLESVKFRIITGSFKGEEFVTSEWYQFHLCTESMFYKQLENL